MKWHVKYNPTWYTTTTTKENKCVKSSGRIHSKESTLGSLRDVYFLLALLSVFWVFKISLSVMIDKWVKCKYTEKRRKKHPLVESSASGAPCDASASHTGQVRSGGSGMETSAGPLLSRHLPLARLESEVTGTREATASASTRSFLLQARQVWRDGALRLAKAPPSSSSSSPWLEALSRFPGGMWFFKGYHHEELLHGCDLWGNINKLWSLFKMSTFMTETEFTGCSHGTDICQGSLCRSLSCAGPGTLLSPLKDNWTQGF